MQTPEQLREDAEWCRNQAGVGTGVGMSREEAFRFDRLSYAAEELAALREGPKYIVPAEPAVPIARLEKLWRRFRQLRGKSLADAKDPGIIHNAEFSGKMTGMGWGYEAAAADLRAVIDEVKKGETR